ncbi:hypothetical protein LCGC14_2056230 [marine sediment metagenome]|uniref:LIM zinc-binding domain-containing protein n=1 Tax=marine sediment metagenome TaxID=412755 RepID=A0A0F9HJK0_9ZZZZ
MITGEQYLFVDVTCYSCGKLMALTNSTEVDGRKFCNNCIEERECATCTKVIVPATEFKDELSTQEYKISGMCQKCQDSVFD